MSIMELGALGEFVGAIAVVVTLAYLAVQIRQNTRAMEESRRLALAQTYQVRADALSIRSRDYVLSARIAGASNLRILIRHVLPGTYSTTIPPSCPTAPGASPH